MIKKITILLLFLFSLNVWSQDKLYYTVSGGVSLGVYEGGFLYYIGHLLKARNKEHLLTHTTGASAGGYNSLLTAFSKCSLHKETSLTDSYYYQGWIPIGVDNLFQKTKVKADQVFSPEDGLDILPKLKKDFLSGFKKDCRIVLGIAVTRFVPVDVEVNKNITAPNMSEEAVIEVIGRGPGVPPLVRNFEFKNGMKRQLLMPFTEDGSENFETLKYLVLASTAFPVAFPPQFLKHCQKQISEPYFNCKGDKIRQNYFIDGGVFNNSPVLLSYTIAKEEGISRDDKFVWVNPHKTSYSQESVKEDLRYLGFFDYSGEFLGNFINSGRSRDLVMISQLSPEINKMILNSEVSLPPAGSPLSAFFGFFEKDFRIFDFYLGMVDAHIFYKNNAPAGKIPIDDEKSPEWTPYFCLKSIILNDKKAEKICQENKDLPNRNFKALFQISLNSLYDQCSKLKKKPNKNGHCLKAFEKNPPPEVLEADPRFGDWNKKEKESDLAYNFRQLSRYNFHYKDLGLKKDDYENGKVALREKLGSITDSWMDMLPDSEQFVLKEGASTFYNQEIYFVPKKFTKYVTLGSAFEVGVNFARVDTLRPTYLKLGASLFAQNGSAWLLGSSSKVSIAPLIGLEGILPFSDYKWQYLLGVKGGYQFTTNDDFGSKPCGDSDAQVAIYSCSGISIMPYIGFTYMQLARFQMIFNWLPQYSSSVIRKAVMFQLGIDF